MPIQLFLSGVILVLLIGMLLGYHLLPWLQRREGRQRDIDRLVEQFQALFRQLDQIKEA